MLKSQVRKTQVKRLGFLVKGEKEKGPGMSLTLGLVKANCISFLCKSEVLSGIYISHGLKLCAFWKKGKAFKKYTSSEPVC